MILSAVLPAFPAAILSVDAQVISDEWKNAYSREKAAYPLPFTRDGKFWPSVRRVDNAYGDRNLVCSCLPVEEYMEENS